uniref:Uncharacterized protein n=1 Tax=Astyanax mexicanus TaxID=7994 RepID=A0A3B1JGT9_ASTMX
MFSLYLFSLINPFCLHLSPPPRPPCTPATEDRLQVGDSPCFMRDPGTSAAAPLSEAPAKLASLLASLRSKKHATEVPRPVTPVAQPLSETSAAAAPLSETSAAAAPLSQTAAAAAPLSQTAAAAAPLSEISAAAAPLSETSTAAAPLSQTAAAAAPLSQTAAAAAPLSEISEVACYLPSFLNITHLNAHRLQAVEFIFFKVEQNI